MLLTTIFFIAFVLVVTALVAVSNKALNMVFAYQAKKSNIKNEDAMEESVNNTYTAALMHLESIKKAAVAKIDTASAQEVLSIQSAIEKRACNLKSLIEAKRSIATQNAQNRAAEQKAYKAKQRAEIAELNAQNRASIRLREMAMSV